MVPSNCKRYETMQSCYDILENGIEVVMFNYDTNKQEPCTLMLDKAHTCLKVNIRKQTFMTKYFTMNNNIAFKCFNGVLYGGISSTFQK